MRVGKRIVEYDEVVHPAMRAVPVSSTAVVLPPVNRPYAILDALAVRDFRLLWTGLIVSNIGSWMQMVGQGWLVLQLTNSPLWLGMVAFARAVPMIGLSLFAGVVADRIDRRKLLLTTQTTAATLALLLAALTSSGRVQVWQIMAIAFLSAATMAFDNPTRQALVPDLVGKERVMTAVGLNSAAWNGAAVAGPALAGVAVGAIGVAGCFYLNATSFLAVVWAVWVMKPPTRSTPRQGTLWFSLVEGLGYIRRHRVVFALFLLTAIPSLLGRPYQSLMPVFARDVLGGGPRTYGALMSASGAGALLGALITASLGSFHRKGLVMLASTGAFGLILIAFAASRSFILSLVILFFAGTGATLYMGSANTLLQTNVPAAFRGRIMSVYTLIAGGLMPLGGMLGGSAATMTGNVSIVVMVGGALVCLSALAIGALVPGIRTLE